MLFACSCVVLYRILPTVQKIHIHNNKLWNTENKDVAIKIRISLFINYVDISNAYWISKNDCPQFRRHFAANCLFQCLSLSSLLFINEYMSLCVCIYIHIYIIILRPWSRYSWRIITTKFYEKKRDFHYYVYLISVITTLYEDSSFVFLSLQPIVVVFSQPSSGL